MCSWSFLFVAWAIIASPSARSVTYRGPSSPGFGVGSLVNRELHIVSPGLQLQTGHAVMGRGNCHEGLDVRPKMCDISRRAHQLQFARRPLCFAGGGLFHVRATVPNGRETAPAFRALSTVFVTQRCTSARIAYAMLTYIGSGNESGGASDKDPAAAVRPAGAANSGRDDAGSLRPLSQIVDWKSCDKGIRSALSKG